jgi:hypothetical protein
MRLSDRETERSREYKKKGLRKVIIYNDEPHSYVMKYPLILQPD